MHEYSIVQSLLDSCESHCKSNDATQVLEITIELGEFSGVEPRLLSIAFDAFKEQCECAKTAKLATQIKPNSSDMLLLRLELQ